MKTFIALLLCFSFVTTVQAQDRWTVQLNSKTLLTAQAEDSLNNVVTIDDLKKGSLIITYTPAVAKGERKRSITITDVKGNELYSKEAFSIAVPAETLKKWVFANPQIKVYTWPALDEGGATIKFRKVHLCTINFTE